MSAIELFDSSQSTSLESYISEKHPILQDVSIIVSAGPTQEAIDPVRYISNRSSGKMGFALAGALARQGAKVTLVAGPVQRPTPQGVERLDVISAQDMADTLFSLAQKADIYIGAAAVADYTVKHAKVQKIKKTAFTQELTLLPTVDIIQSLAQRYPHYLWVLLLKHKSLLLMLEQSSKIKHSIWLLLIR